REGKINGLRIDHPDGLYDPAQYFHRLQCGQDCPTPNEGCADKPTYIVIEKILTGDERLPNDWPVHGTTGYDFANLVNALFVDPGGEVRMDRLYRAFIGHQVNFDDLVYECKKLILDRALNSELNVLANSLSRIALANRHTCDFTLKSLRDALTEVAACFPVYRTYISEKQISESDRAYIDEAVECAKGRNTPADCSVYDFIRDVLLTEQGAGHTKSYQRAVVRFAMKFQQLTGALMAKGLEDTAFYRYNRLVSLNDVGGDPRRFGVSPEEFHRQMAERAAVRPHRMLSTSTHDSKRSEDVRARINVLSEIPILWRRHVRRWREWNHSAKRNVDGVEAPSRNDEYLLYQTLIGAWPTGAREAQGDFTRRIREYMLKAVREAKQHTSWANPKKEYEDAVAEFVETCLNKADFVSDFAAFHRRIARCGMFNSISQTLIKLTAPGVPDTYQGNEIWDLSLVDPDNRRPVDYDLRKKALQQIEQAARHGGDELRDWARALMEPSDEGRSKMYVSWRTLAVRRCKSQLFENGDYLPLTVTGEKAAHVVAFARKQDEDVVVVAVPRLCAQLLGEEGHAPLGNEVWDGTRIELPFAVAELRNEFTGEMVRPDSGSLPVASLLKDFPVALLTSSGDRRG
ncbi:MAG TPA: malto-oligosyltrehalose synthase, partial [Terriglobales bacterium]|nr:malto-oligosyltrehalose synthase [Terriglobales bacterium]